MNTFENELNEFITINYSVYGIETLELLILNFVDRVELKQHPDPMTYLSDIFNNHPST